MTTRAERDMECALELVYGGDQAIEAGCVLDKLADMGWSLRQYPLPGQIEAWPEASTKPLPKRRTA